MLSWLGSPRQLPIARFHGLGPDWPASLFSKRTVELEAGGVVLALVLSGALEAGDISRHRARFSANRARRPQSGRRSWAEVLGLEPALELFRDHRLPGQFVSPFPLRTRSLRARAEPGSAKLPPCLIQRRRGSGKPQGRRAVGTRPSGPRSLNFADLDALPPVPWAPARKAGAVAGDRIHTHAMSITETELDWFGHRLPPIPL
jgi:hypothetical protein